MNFLEPELSTVEVPPLEFVEVEKDEEGFACPEEFRQRIMVDAIHDGNFVPKEFLVGDDGHPMPPMEDIYVLERDWGAEMLAAYLASALHIEGYFRVNVARVLMDFGRFPGITPKSATHMSRFAINYPFSAHLGFDQKKQVLEEYYDKVSQTIDGCIHDKLVKVAIHTYDEKNPADTRRPAVSVVSRAHIHANALEIPEGTFDPLFPHELTMFCADPILSSRIGLTLEEAAIHVADNYPYSLPEGSVEVRAQVWFFFRHIKEEYEKVHPQPRRDEPSPRDWVWDMLFDTNLRKAESAALRSYLHMFRKPPAGSEALFASAKLEYQEITRFVRQNEKRLVTEYRDSPERPSSLLIEVRKDLVWDFEDGKPVRPLTDNARMVARYVAQAIQSYLNNDRKAKLLSLAINGDRFD